MPREQRIRTTALALSSALGDLPLARVVLEAGGTLAVAEPPRGGTSAMRWSVANPRQVALIAGSQRKTDRLDAAWLARLGRFDPALLAPIRHRSEQSQHRPRRGARPRRAGALQDAAHQPRTRAVKASRRRAGPSRPAATRPGRDR